MSNVAAGVILTAGALVWGNEWLQVGASNIHWRVPVATLLGAGIIDLLARVDNGAAVGLSIIVFIGAVTTPFNGKSVVWEFNQVLSSKQMPSKGKKAHPGVR